MFEKILVPVDGSNHAQRAIDAACELAKLKAGEVTLLHVMEHAASSRVPVNGSSAARPSALDYFDSIDRSENVLG